ncbi:hypothetical protein Sjap_007551 [Stephania japonica]|uniref:Myb-like domain-containing protein n=1 Tax=Stephania japonica TaxID=461633 RepID=A0AAP0PAJ0_9MAGN
MTPAAAKKSRTAIKRVSKINDDSPDKDGSKNKQKKRKLSDMLGPQWSKEELERFYTAYRKYGKEWKKVATLLRNRSIDMVEALYNMNRAYLSLPEGTASVVGLTAMMTDHYNILDGSESERESNDGPGVSKKPRHGRGKFRANISKGLDGNVPDLLHSQSVVSNHGCLSLLKKRRSGGSRPRAVGKRTPRFPVSYLYDRHKEGLKSELDANDDEVAHEAVLALAKASQRGGSPQLSQTPNRRSELTRFSVVHHGERMHGESGMRSSIVVGVAPDEDGLEGSLGSREAENADFVRDTSYMMDTEGVGTMEVQQKGKTNRRRKRDFQTINNDHLEDVREACSGTEEGLDASSARERAEAEVTDFKIERPSPQGSRKRGRQLFFDESTALEALYTLADVSMQLAPAATVESESSVQYKEEKVISNAIEKFKGADAVSANYQKDATKLQRGREKGHHLVSRVSVPAVRSNKVGKDSALDFGAVSDAKQQQIRKRKRKSLSSKISESEALDSSHVNEPRSAEVLAEEGKKSTSKLKRAGQMASLPRQGKSVKPPERSSPISDPVNIGGGSAAIQFSRADRVSLPTRVRSRRKMDLQKALISKELKSTESMGNDPPYSFHVRTLALKQMLSHCLSSPLLRRWCTFEWLYSAIDYPWFAKREFVEYLNHVGLGHVPRLTRVEWGVIRSSLGKPRRLSQQFLREEKEKLELYRESVRTQYTELRTGIRVGLPGDLAQPLSVGQRVIACHPKSRELHDGSVLTVDRNRCRVQFDRPELGVEFVMDMDCMPLNPLENMPEALRRQSCVANKLHENFNEPQANGQLKDWKTGVYSKSAPSENLENGDCMPHVSSSMYPMSTLLRQAKGDTINAVSQAKAAAGEIVNAQKAAYSQPCTLAQIQAREADVRALSELTRALDKKEALLLELKHLNDEVLENQKDGDNSLKDSETFKKQYAMVSSALLYLRERNKYQGSSAPSWMKPVTNSTSPAAPLSSFDQSGSLPQEPGSRVVEILKNSRLKAQTMVDAAVQAMSSLKEGDDPFYRVGKSLGSVNNQNGVTDSGIVAERCLSSQDSVHGLMAHPDSTNSCMLESNAAVDASNPKSNDACGLGELQIPSELISSCVATLFMIQTCTERQYPPADVAQILDSTVKSLQPCCPQNVPIYSEIQMCMGLIKNQILALIPS